MIILTLTNCPPALRGDLTKWLVEIHTGVYVGRVSARVRDNLWDRVKEHSKTGKATLVYPAKMSNAWCSVYTIQHGNRLILMA